MTEQNFAQIVEQSKHIVLHVIRKYLFEDFCFAIDDIVQETYLRAYKSLSKNQFRNDAKINSWLYIIARNETVRMNKKLSKNNKIINAKAIELKENEVHFESDYEELFSKEKPGDFLTALPDKHREVLVLYLKGLSEANIAKELFLACGTVKSRLHRAKKKLRKLIEKKVDYEQNI
jgi:RNA polymerase sigma-70 factor, ECF subfamily